MSVWITGDTHSRIDHISYKHFPKGRKLTRDDYLIISGDFGFIWKAQADTTELYNFKWFSERPYTILFIDGNHENFPRIAQFPIVEKFGGKVGHISDNVFHLRRGEVYNIDGIKIFTMGGALSIDKAYRTEWLDWWKEENISHGDVHNAITNLFMVKDTVDVVISHTCPSSVFDLIPDGYIDKKLKVDDKNMEILEHFKNSINFKRWYFGHFHLDLDLDERFTVMYKSFTEIKK